MVASRDPFMANTFWQHVCGGEMPLQWDSRELLYRRTVSHPGYDLSMAFVMQVLDDTMRDMVRMADVLIFLLSDLPSDEEKYLADLRALNPRMSVFSGVHPGVAGFAWWSSRSTSRRHSSARTCYSAWMPFCSGETWRGSDLTGERTLLQSCPGS